MELEVEVWKDITNYEGEYRVSSFGNLKSIKFGRELVLKPTVGNNGYMVINLNRKTFTVHQIVAITFHGHVPCRYDVVVDHKDNNKLNNRADNLRLTTNRENTSKDKKGGTSKYIGVYYSKTGKWGASIVFKKRLIRLGSFDLEIDAKNAYDKALDECNQGLDLNLLYPKWRNKSSKYIGVSWYSLCNKWTAKYKQKIIGRYDTELEAYEALQSYIKQLQLISEVVI